MNRGKTFSVLWENENAEVARFEDDTSILAASTSGNLFLDEDLIKSINVHRAFWVAVTLAYLEFAEDSEVRKAISSYYI